MLIKNTSVFQFFFLFICLLLKPVVFELPKVSSKRGSFVRILDYQICRIRSVALRSEIHNDGFWNRAEYDLDTVTNAPGINAFNRVERRMAALSRELTGVVFPNEFFGTHLDTNGRTVDVSLEKDNFKKAGEILAEIWSAVCFDEHEVVAMYIDPYNGTYNVPDLPSEELYAEHIRESQCLLQVVKCDNWACCSPRHSYLHFILHERFLSPPYPITQIDEHLTIPDPGEHDGKLFALFLMRHCLPIQPLHAFMDLPYDQYCPSVRGDLEKRCCNTCGINFSSITRAAEHRRVVYRAATHKVRPSRIITCRTNELLCASDNGLEWLNQSEVEGYT